MNTGSAVTIVHHRLWEQEQLSQNFSHKLQQLTGGLVVTAKGEPLSILGQTRCKISLVRTDFIHGVLVANDVSQDCLLGADFLSTHGFTIDLKLHVLSSGSMSTSLLQAQTMSTSCCQVSILNSVVIRPEEEKIFWGEVDCSLPFSQPGVLEPKDCFEEQHQLLLARVVLTSRNQMVPLRAANLTTSPVTLYKGTTIARFFPFSKTESCSATGLMKVQTMFLQAQDVSKTQQANLSAAAVLGIDLSTMDCGKWPWKS